MEVYVCGAMCAFFYLLGRGHGRQMLKIATLPIRLAFGRRK